MDGLKKGMEAMMEGFKDGMEEKMEVLKEGFDICILIMCYHFLHKN